MGDKTSIPPLTGLLVSLPQPRYPGAKGGASGCGGACGLWEVLPVIRPAGRDGEAGRQGVYEGERGRDYWEGKLGQALGKP